MLLSLLRSCRSSCSCWPICSFGIGVSIGSCGQDHAQEGQGGEDIRVMEDEGREGARASSRLPCVQGALSLPSGSPRSAAARLRGRGDGADARGAAGPAAWARGGAPLVGADPPAGPWAGAEGLVCLHRAWGSLRTQREGTVSRSLSAGPQLLPNQPPSGSPVNGNPSPAGAFSHSILTTALQGPSTPLRPWARRSDKLCS